MAGWLLQLLSFVGAIQLVNGASVQVSGGAAHPPAAPDSTHTLIDAVVGINGASAAQCWSIEPPFTVSDQPGTTGAKVQVLGDNEGSNLVSFPNTGPVDGGIHHAPSPEYFMVLKGSGVISFPATNATALQLPNGGIFIAVDTPDVSTVGHETKWTSGAVVLQTPFKGGVVPGHTVVNPSGGCAALQGHHHHY